MEYNLHTHAMFFTCFPPEPYARPRHATPRFGFMNMNTAFLANGTEVQDKCTSFAASRLFVTVIIAECFPRHPHPTPQRK